MSGGIDDGRSDGIGPGQAMDESAFVIVGGEDLDHVSMGAGGRAVAAQATRTMSGAIHAGNVDPALGPDLAAGGTMAHAASRGADPAGCRGQGTRAPPAAR